MSQSPSASHAGSELKIIEQLGRARQILLNEIHKVIIGQDEVIELLLLAHGKTP